MTTKDPLDFISFSKEYACLSKRVVYSFYYKDFDSRRRKRDHFNRHIPKSMRRSLCYQNAFSNNMVRNRPSSLETIR